MHCLLLFSGLFHCKILEGRCFILFTNLSLVLEVPNSLSWPGSWDSCNMRLLVMKLGTLCSIVEHGLYIKPTFIRLAVLACKNLSGVGLWLLIFSQRRG